MAFNTHHFISSTTRTCDLSLTDFLHLVLDGGSDKQVDVVGRTQEDVLQNQQLHLSSFNMLYNMENIKGTSEEHHSAFYCTDQSQVYLLAIQMHTNF